jgi:hypothetical protein
MSKKRKSEILIEEIHEKLNSVLGDDVLDNLLKMIEKKENPTGICFNCKKFIFNNDEIYIESSKYSEERSFCQDCVFLCKGCDQNYINQFQHEHKKCLEDSDQE